MARSFSDRFFKFPVRMYKTEDIEALFREEEKDPFLQANDEMDIEYVIGYAKVLPYDILEWYDSFSRPRSIQDVKRDGFDSTTIKTKAGEMYNCTWKRERFEANLNRFVEELEREMEEEIDQALKKE